MYQLVYPTLLQPIAFRLWQIYLPKIVRQCGKLSSSLPGIAAHLWWAMMIGWVIWVDISGQSDILVLADVPHPLPNYNCTKHESYRTKSFQERSSSTFYNLPPLSSTIIRFYAWTGNWWISISNGYGYMDLNPICHPSPAHKRMKCSFLDYVQLLMMDQAGWWTQTLSATPLQPEKWNAHFWITFNFWWSAGLLDGREPHPPLLFSQKSEMLIFGLCSTSDDRPGWSMDSNPNHHPAPARKMKCSFFNYVQLLMMGPAGQWTGTLSATPLQPEKWNAHFWIMFNFWWWVGLVNGLEPHPPPLSSQENEMLIFRLCSTSGDRPSNPSNKSLLKCDKRPPKSSKNEIFIFINYVQLLMIGQVIQATKVDQNVKKTP